MEKTKFQIVLLECPYDSLEDPLARELLAKTAALKIKGYKAEYPYGVLPVSTSDWVGSHHIVCEVRNGELFPVMAYKSVTKSRFEIHGLTFGGLEVLASEGASEHLESVRIILEQAKWAKHEISYDSSWTIDPEIRKNEDMVKQLRGIMQAIHVLYHVDYGISEIIAGGSTRFKMEKLYHYWGYRELELNGKKLIPLKLKAYANEEVLFFHLKNFSAQALKDAEAFRKLWNERIAIGAPGVPFRKAA